MYEPFFTTRFKRDVKRQNKRNKPLEKLAQLIDEICENGDAPEEFRPHNLSGNWSGYRECHLEPDWLVIFIVQPEVVTFYRTGTHSDLFRK